MNGDIAILWQIILLEMIAAPLSKTFRELRLVKISNIKTGRFIHDGHSKFILII